MDETRIVLVRGSSSEWYEQAIFILKDPRTARRKNLLAEAERIINEHMLSERAKALDARLEQYKRSISERAELCRRAGKAGTARSDGREQDGKTGDCAPLLTGSLLVSAGVLLGCVLRGLTLP